MEPRRPDPRMIRTPRDAEKAARDWMVYLGYRDAHLKRKGPDEGIDVEAAEALAQVKAGETPTGRPVVQQIYGVADLQDKKPVLFTVAGVTNEAQEWADRSGVAVFQLDLAGQVRPMNGAAWEMMATAEGALNEWQAVAAELESRLAAREEVSITAEFTAPDGGKGFWGIWVDRIGSIRVTGDITGASHRTVTTVREAVDSVEAIVETMGADYSHSRPVLTVSEQARPFQPRLTYPGPPCHPA